MCRSLRNEVWHSTDPGPPNNLADRHAVLAAIEAEQYADIVESAVTSGMILELTKGRYDPRLLLQGYGRHLAGAVWRYHSTSKDWKLAFFQLMRLRDDVLVPSFSVDEVHSMYSLAMFTTIY